MFDIVIDVEDLLFSFIYFRCKTFKHPSELTRRDKAVWFWGERAAYRLNGQFLRWNKILYVGMLVSDLFHVNL